jgi:hypothetical protein
MVLNTDTLSTFMREDHFAQLALFDIFPPRSGVQCLHDNHVPAITALIKESAGCRVGLERGNNLPLRSECYLRRNEQVFYLNDITTDCN